MPVAANVDLAGLRIKNRKAFDAYLAKVIELYGGDITVMGEQLRTHRNTIRRWIRESPTLRAKLHEVRR